MFAHYEHIKGTDSVGLNDVLFNASFIPMQLHFLTCFHLICSTNRVKSKYPEGTLSVKVLQFDSGSQPYLEGC